MITVIARDSKGTPSLPGLTHSGVHEAIGLVNASNFVGPVKTIGHAGGWRADRQTAPSGFANIHIQKNNVNSPSSVACVLIPLRFAIALSDDIKLRKPGSESRYAQFSELTRAIHRALNFSFNSRSSVNGSGKWVMQPYEIGGDFSS